MTDKNYRIAQTAGVSESIGFLLIFTIMIAGIGLVTLYGYPMLVQTQTSADKQIMEKNMVVLQNDIKSLTYKTVPYKETSMNVGGGALTIYNSTTASETSTFTIYDHASGTPYESAFHPGDLRYVSNGAGEVISIQNGAVLIRPVALPGSTMFAQPRWFHDATMNTMVINLISLNSTTQLGRSGVGTVQMSMGQANYSVISLPAGKFTCVGYTPASTDEDYTVAWSNYFNTLGMTHMNCGLNYTLPLDPAIPATLIIKKYDVQIQSL